jgi:tetratricopeptide (TPR) repeat protein
MAKKTTTATDSVAQAEKSVGEIISKTDKFLEKNLKTVVIAVVAIFVIIVGYFALRQLYLVPREKEAQVALYPAQNAFEYQQWALALNGDSIGFAGFLEIADEYSGTTSGNLAKAYAGLCQAHLGDYKAALENLEDYDTTDQLFAAQVLAAIGDCYVSSEKPEKGITCFQKAAEKANNKALSPLFLNKAAEVYGSLGDNEKALKIYTKIQAEYPEFAAANAIEKYIERAKIIKN